MGQKRLLWLWALLIVQALCAAYFLVDGLFDWFGMESANELLHFHSFELFVAVALLAGLAATLLQIREIARRQDRLRQQIDVASGAFAELIEAQFDAWRLSASERDVALMALKGLSVAEIAAIRNTREGTIKAQSAAVYRKAGVSGRLQLMSLFIDELLAAPLVATTPD